MTSAKSDPQTYDAPDSLQRGEGAALTIVVPTYREAQNIEALVTGVFAVTSASNIPTEVIVVDDDSQDGIDVTCRELAARHDIRLITRTGIRGLATAVLHGMTQARGRFLLCMDADLSHPPEAIPDMVKALSSGADFVLGSRYARGGKIERGWGPHRLAISRLAALLARPLTSVTDPMSGFFALSRADFLRANRLAPLGYKVALELLVKLDPQRITEIPIRFGKRRAGKSKLSLGVQLQYLRHLARLYRYKFLCRQSRRLTER
jgi:dolichol-phosphate mannosyltransferase